MKTIEISDEMYEELINISKELNTQNHRGTSMPYILQVRDFRKVSADDGYSDNYLLINPDNDNEEIEAENYKDLIEYLKENDYYEEIEDEIKEIIENNKKYESAGEGFIYDEIVDLLEEKYEFYKWNYQEIEEFKNAFFTDKGVKEYLKSNYYHFSEKADTFLQGLPRNSEMEIVMKFLCELSGGKIYK